MSENDQPYSANWESYKLVNLDGADEFSVSNRSATWEEVFLKLQPTCPDCATVLTPENMKVG